jgi:hypothetical protein
MDCLEASGHLSASAPRSAPRRRRWPLKQALRGIRDSKQTLQHVHHLGRAEAGQRRLDLLPHCLAAGHLARA